MGRKRTCQSWKENRIDKVSSLILCLLKLFIFQRMRDVIWSKSKYLKRIWFYGLKNPQKCKECSLLRAKPNTLCFFHFNLFLFCLRVFAFYEFKNLETRVQKWAFHPTSQPLVNETETELELLINK